MPKKSSALSRSLQAMDLFEDSIHLNVDGARSLKSALGGLLSLAIIIFLAVQLILQIISIHKRENPTIVQMKDIQDDPLLVSLNDTNNFVFAIGVSQDNVVLDMSQGSAVSFVGKYTHQIRDTSGNLTKHVAAILWAPCVETNFSTKVFPDTTFSSYSLQFAYCPTMMNFTDATTGICPDEIKTTFPSCMTPFAFSLQGNFLSFNFRYLQVSVHSCDPSDSTVLQGLQCSSNTSLFNSSEFKVNLYYANTLVNPVDYKTPNKSYIDTIYWSVDPSVYKLADIYIDSVTVQDYDDYFSSSKYRNRSFFSLDSDNIRETQVFHRTNMLELNLRRSNTNDVTIRRYSKALDVISSIGGISKVLLVVGAVIALGYSRYKHQMMLSNKLYDFPPKHTAMKGVGLYMKKTLGVVNSQRNNTSTSQLKLPTKKKTMEDDTVKKYFDKQKAEKRILAFDTLDYLKSVFHQLTCKKDDPEEQLASKARAQVVADLNVIKIVEKLKEIDKLKMILLNRYQREAFNFIEKPLITLKNQKPWHRDSVDLLQSPDDSPVKSRDRTAFDSRQEYNSMSKYARLYMAYTELKADTDPRNWKTNKKILNMIGEDLIGVFQKVDEQLGENPDPKKFEEMIQKLSKGDSTETPVELKNFESMLS